MQAAATCAHKNLFIEKFNDLEDPRRTDKGNHRHKLSDILLKWSRLSVTARLNGLKGSENSAGASRQPIRSPGYSRHWTLSHIENLEKWQGLKSIVRIETGIYDKKSGETSREERFYISSLDPDAFKLNRAIRKHWAVENNLHWALDVQFGEDASRKRKGFEAQNFNIILKMVMAVLKNDTASKISIPRKRMKAALDPKYSRILLNF